MGAGKSHPSTTGAGKSDPNIMGEGKNLQNLGILPIFAKPKHYETSGNWQYLPNQTVAKNKFSRDEEFSECESLVNSHNGGTIGQQGEML